MKELSLSIFADESGGQNETSKYYLLTLVFHDQAQTIDLLVKNYQASLAHKRLPDIPFHASPLINGKGEYENMDMADRKKLLACFFVFARKLPISYKTFSYRRSEIPNLQSFVTNLRRDLIVFVFDNLNYFQQYDSIKVYYDGGQPAISATLHKAIDYSLSKNAVVFKDADPQEYRLSQVADFLCTIELSALKYANKEETKTDIKVFGHITEFKKGYLRHLRKKSLS